VTFAHHVAAGKDAPADARVGLVDGDVARPGLDQPMRRDQERRSSAAFASSSSARIASRRGRKEADAAAISANVRCAPAMK
jgi:hypothetical protein